MWISHFLMILSIYPCVYWACLFWIMLIIMGRWSGSPLSLTWCRWKDPLSCVHVRTYPNFKNWRVFSNIISREWLLRRREQWAWNKVFQKFTLQLGLSLEFLFLPLFCTFSNLIGICTVLFRRVKSKKKFISVFQGK